MAEVSDPRSKGIGNCSPRSCGIDLHGIEMRRYSKMRLQVNDDERNRMCHAVEALRQARGRVLQGSSQFLDIVQVIEMFGKEHWKKQRLRCINKKLAGLIDSRNTGGSREEAERLLDSMREGRNEAVHEGTLGRRLARNCVRVSIMVEEALRREAEMSVVSDYLVETIVHARLWQSLRTIRRTMMENEFTHLPFENERRWYTVDAEALCVYRDQHREEEHVWSRSLRCAKERTDKPLEVRKAELVDLHDDIHEATEKLEGKGLLLVRGNCDNEVVGVLTAFDLLV